MIDQLLKSLVEVVGEIVKGTAAVSAEDRARLSRELRESADRLDAIEPNLPAIHALGEETRERIRAAEEERTERGDETTREVPPDLSLGPRPR